ncbi:cytochrome c nitrite reductase pentaheme subunit [Ursidibacter arcticus]|uniref:cytochrome c nitrite reductase pentaheme subunit n=1 Tax=Ursidibacter arcticus TaxID=1524965 RepID=UPI0012F84196|nr:cytochrome c nitrite reductase pentaheme subunit [Ursidibacter arcticus]KAE9532907.1 cytochrome c nitrite reductase pentaheme subunit [Ursidibacter arcticus]
MKHFLSKVGRMLALQAVTLVGFFAISSTAMAEMPAPPKPLWEQDIDDATIAKDARRDPNTYCVNCHGHLSNFKHHGKHFQHGTVSPNTGKPLTCVSCHGNISENHRKGVKDVMRFNAFGKAKNKDLERSPQEQNQVCFACHNPDKLREVFWAHDTHANKMACVNCHKLHPEQEPMKATEPKQRVKLCVDCHSRIHEKKSKSLEPAKEIK